MAIWWKSDSHVPEDRLGKKLLAGRIRLEYLDGLRGVCALFVVVHHSYLSATWNVQLPSGLLAASSHILHHGHLAVGMFIVLSGYCLMLPAVTSADHRIGGGSLIEFFRRRFRRIVPPYYAALTFSCLMILLVPDLQKKSGGWWDNALPAFTPGALISHLLLIQNFNEQWINKINLATWSVAPEWQIYFVFALVLLPVWRRVGIFAAVLLGVILGFGCHFVAPSLDIGCPWYIALFSFGMAGAVFTMSPDQGLIAFSRKLPWGTVAVVLASVLAFPKIFHLPGTGVSLPLEDFITGLMGMCLITCCSLSLAYPAKNLFIRIFLRLFESKPLLWLGAFSYSLYLTHTPVICAINAELARYQLDVVSRAWVMQAIAVPGSIITAYFFYLCFERPFIAKRPGRFVLTSADDRALTEAQLSVQPSGVKPVPTD